MAEIVGQAPDRGAGERRRVDRARPAERYAAGVSDILQRASALFFMSEERSSPGPRKRPDAGFPRPSTPPPSRSGGTASGGGGPFPAAGPPGLAAVRHGHPAAQRHGQAPHRPRLRAHDRGHPRALDAHARAPRPVGAGHRPRRASPPRWSWRGSSPSRGSTGATSGARSSSSASGPGNGKPRTRSSRS